MFTNYIPKRLYKPTALDIARRELAESEINRLRVMSQVEYYVAIEKMYRERVGRLEADILELEAKADILELEAKAGILELETKG